MFILRLFDHLTVATPDYDSGASVVHSDDGYLPVVFFVDHVTKPWSPLRVDGL